ncbi:UMP kinase [Candidatus Peregrinibacteria bacterium]|nr:UMP kinase [Candidatus Peregrinibacteria bacterium]
MARPFQKIMLKLSGEALNGESELGIDASALFRTVSEIKKARQKGLCMAITVGGGNIWRYRDALGLPIERCDSDYLGMMATLFNAVCLRAEFEKQGVVSYACSRLSVPKVLDDYDRRAVRKRFEDGEAVILAGGTGNPYFTTDSSSALSALELGCDILLKATKVPYVYDRDPVRYPSAKSFRELSYSEVLTQNYQVMDATAISLCQDAKLPIRVFDFFENGNLKALCGGKDVGTLIF